jgi:3-dehydroquinate synthetase
MGITEPGTTERLVSALNRLGLPTSLDGRVSVERALSFIERDKKVRSGEVRCVLLKAFGRVASDPPRWSCAVEWVALDSALREL